MATVTLAAQDVMPAFFPQNQGEAKNFGPWFVNNKKVR